MTDETINSEQVEEKEPVETAEEATSAEAETPPTIEEQLELAMAEVASLKDSSLRAQAELANARKRFEKQRLQAYTSANAELAAKLLPALDDFERAMENVPEAISEDSWFSGMELVQRKLTSILEGMGLQPIEAVGEPFDPNYHEAIGAEDSAEFESGIVTREMQKGYQLGDRVVRPSLVMVAA